MTLESRIAIHEIRRFAPRKERVATLLRRAGRVSGGDKARVFGIARGETIEAVCSVEIAVESGAGSREALPRVLEHGKRAVRDADGAFAGAVKVRASVY